MTGCSRSSTRTAAPPGSRKRWRIWSIRRSTAPILKEAWRRFRLRGPADRRFLGVLKTVAAWREAAAQQRDLPRGRIMKDEAILEIAAHAPKTIEQLARTRSLPRGVAEGKLGQDILDAVAQGLADPDPPPAIAGKAEPPPGIGPLIELLRVLLKQRVEDLQVAQKLIASSDDLEAIAADDNAAGAGAVGLAARIVRQRRAGAEARPPRADRRKKPHRTGAAAGARRCVTAQLRMVPPIGSCAVYELAKRENSGRVCAIDERR